MNWDRIEGKWDQFTASLKQKWAKLTDDDIKLIGGKKDMLIGKLLERYGSAKEHIEADVDSWIDSIDEKKATRH